MGRKPDAERLEQIRFAPNTMVCWFEGRKEVTGRVLLNIRRGPGLAPNVVVRDGQGARHIISGEKLFVKSGGSPS